MRIPQFPPLPEAGSFVIRTNFPRIPVSKRIRARKLPGGQIRMTGKEFAKISLMVEKRGISEREAASILGIDL